MSRGRIDYKTDVKVRWAKLEEEIFAWPREQREAILMGATEYRSGEDSCNSVYMGSIAHAALLHVLGDRYPSTVPYTVSIPAASDETLNRAITACMHTIEYMLHNPRKKCPCCGQIIEEEDEE